MEAAYTSEISVNFYQTTWRNIPEGIHLHIRRREKLKSHIAFLVFCAPITSHHTLSGVIRTFLQLSSLSNCTRIFNPITPASV
jgi:hypothetical protein